MIKIKKYFYPTVIIALLLVGCKDESLITLPEWESAVHGYAELSAGSKDNFKNGDQSIDVSFDLK